MKLLDYPYSTFLKKGDNSFDWLVKKSISKTNIILLRSNNYYLEWVSKPLSIPKELYNKVARKTANDMFKTILNIEYSIKHKIKERKNVNVYRIKKIEGELYIINLCFKREKNKNFKRIKDFTPNLDFLDFGGEFIKPNHNPFSRQFKVEFKRRIYKRDNYTCQYCGWKNGLPGIPDRILTIDHIVAIAHGGTTKEENVVTCCLQCNIKKNDRLILDIQNNKLIDIVPMQKYK